MTQMMNTHTNAMHTHVHVQSELSLWHSFLKQISHPVTSFSLSLSLSLSLTGYLYWIAPSHT